MFSAVTRRQSLVIITFLILVSITSHASDSESVIKKYKSEPIHPLSQTINLDTDKVNLGRKLFHDERLSRDNTISCATCHPLDNAGVDGLERSIGINGAEGIVNTPTVLNSGFNITQFWDGRALTLEDQIDGPVHNPVEMDSNWNLILSKLVKDTHYQKTFKSLYPNGLTASSVKDAIATFERSLITPNSRFDHFLRGESDAITPFEKEGYLLFKSYGCSSCHQGKAVGGNMYEKMGVMGDYFKMRGNLTSVDYGRYNFTKIEEHKFEFKVPGLRNIELTAPYFHDGYAKTLEEAVIIMSRYQLGRPINQKDLAKIVAFLKTLTGIPLEKSGGK